MTSDINPPSTTQPLSVEEIQSLCRTTVTALRNLNSFMVQNVHKPEELLRLLAENDRQIQLLGRALTCND